MARRIRLTLTVACVLALGACSGERETDTGAQAPVFDDAADFHVALEAIPGIDCGRYIDLRKDVPAGFDEQAALLDGLTGVGACFGEDSLMVYLFEDPEARERFTGGQDWVAAARIYDCVRDGQVFVGVAGGNWVAQRIDGPPTRLFGAADLLMDELDGQEVLGVPAQGTSVSCDRSSSPG